MKFLHMNDVVYGYAAGDPTVNGGAERYQWLLARAMAHRGWSAVVGVRKGLAEQERRTIEGVEFVGIGDDHILRSWNRFLKTEQPDWWFWQCADHWLGLAVEIAKLNGVRFIFSAMVDLDVIPHRALVRRPSLWPLYAWGLRRSNRIVVQHGDQLNQLAPSLRSKASILPGIVGQTLEVKPHAAGRNYVAWVGVLRQPKRPDLLLEIAKRLPDVPFVVCGGFSTFMTPEGFAEPIVEKLKALSNVQYLGQVAPRKTLEIIGNAAMLLSTSQLEGFPSVFLEAWAAGTPVVSLKIDPDGVIQRKNLGTLSGTVEIAVRDIATLMQSRDRREEMSLRARQHVKEAHSDEAAIRVIESVITR
ncbi:MAG: glycosyltransferase family 4 protein [Nitrospirales bacterium]